MTKQQFINKLANKGLFWTYKIDHSRQLPDSIVIEQVLCYGDVPDYLQLFEIYGKEKVKQIWTERVIPDKRFYAHNYYLAKIFFDIEDAENYIKSNMKRFNRYERIKKHIT